MGEVELFHILPGFCEPEDQEYVDDALMAGNVTTEEVDSVTLTLIEMVSGRPWWVAVRMINVAELKWGTFGAEMAMIGIDPTRISLAAWLDVLWQLFFRFLDPQKWVTFTAQIEAPPPGEAPRDSIESMEMSTDSFTALMRG